MRNLDAAGRIGRRSFLAISAGGTLLATLPASPLSAQARLGKIDYGVASIDPLYSVIYVALKQKLFAAEGLDVNYINSQSGPRSKQMLAAGQLFITTTGVNDSVALSLAGKPSTVVFSLDRRVPFANILVHKDNYGPGKLQKVADLAESFELNIAPHNYNGHLSTFQSLNLCASVSNVRIMESDPEQTPYRDELFTAVPEIRDGHMTIPTAPGWGTELNEKAAKKYPWTG